MNTVTRLAGAGSGSAMDGRPTLTRTGEQRVRTLAPTVFCPATEVQQCIEQAEARRMT